METYSQLQARAERFGFTVRRYAPGDGVARYRFFALEDAAAAGGYFAGDGVRTVLGIAAARTYVDGIQDGVTLGFWA